MTTAASNQGSLRVTGLTAIVDTAVSTIAVKPVTRKEPWLEAAVVIRIPQIAPDNREIARRGIGRPGNSEIPNWAAEIGALGPYQVLYEGSRRSSIRFKAGHSSEPCGRFLPFASGDGIDISCAFDLAITDCGGMLISLLQACARSCVWQARSSR